MRADLKKIRDAIAPDKREQAAMEIAGAAQALFVAEGLVARDELKVISGSHSFGSEIDCLPLMDALARAGHVTALPVIVAKDKPLAFRQWRPGQPVVPGRWDIPVPAPNAMPAIPDILLVPLLGFDRQGYRIGYGGGFYDRTLAALSKGRGVQSVGLAFAAQEVDEIPVEPHDMPLQWVLTEAGLIKCGA